MSAAGVERVPESSDQRQPVDPSASEVRSELITNLRTAIGQTRMHSGDAIMLAESVVELLEDALNIIDRVRAVQPELVKKAEEDVYIRRASVI